MTQDQPITAITEYPPIDPIGVLRAMRNDIGDWAADEIERLNAENARLRAALVTLSRYDDGLRASNWPGLADVVREALTPRDDGS